MTEPLQVEHLQEYADSRGLSVRVDREAGVLAGVKLIGLTSRNGRRYRESALSEAAGLYEGAKVNVNHPKAGSRAPRDYQDRLGVIRGVEFRTGEGLFADLHFNPKHSLAEQLLWDAEHNPRNVGFSHNVEAKVTRNGDGVEVDAITRVESVDLVADPAATEGLFEHTSQTTTDRQSHTIGSVGVAELEARLVEAESELALYRRKEMVGRLLREYRLQLVEATPQQEAREAPTGSVGPAFFEMLLAVEDEQQLEKLISERAAMIREANDWRLHGAPRSREQVATDFHAALVPVDPKEFARSLKV